MRYLLSYRNDLEKEVSEFLYIEAARTAADIKRRLDQPLRRAYDHTDPDQQGVHPAGDRDREIAAAVAVAIAGIDTSRWLALGKSLAPRLNTAAQRVVDDTIDETGGELTPDQLGELRSQAAKWAQERAAELVGHRHIGQPVPVTDAEHSLPESTAMMIAPMVRDAVEAGAGLSALTIILRGAVAFSPARARRVADYEIKNALHHATMLAYKHSGVVVATYWNTAGDDKVTAECAKNEAASPVPLGRPFPSGHFSPMAHPGCRCFLSPVLRTVSRETPVAKSADDTVSQDEAEYQDEPNGEEHCSGCTMYVPAGACSYVRGDIAPDGWCRFYDRAAVTKGHVTRSNAETVSLPLADSVTQANCQHLSWSLFRDGDENLEERTVPINSLIATQQVVDRQRVARDARDLREHGQDAPDAHLPMVLDGSIVDDGDGNYYDGHFFVIEGHHHSCAALEIGMEELRVQVLTKGD